MFDIVKKASNQINNNRTIQSIYQHMYGEMVELSDEITKIENNQPEGVDGIVGESIDIIACALDMIFKQRPDITEEELNNIMQAKCNKWIKKYSDKDYTI